MFLVRLLLFKLRIWGPLGGFLILFSSLLSCANADEKEKNIHETQNICKWPALERSQELIRTILDDLAMTYHDVGGGGTSRVMEAATGVFVVSISQEERIDQITYTFEVGGNCEVRILTREESAISPWEKTQ